MHEPEPIAETPSVSRPRMNVIEDEPAPAPPLREGLPPGFRMRADAHYVDQLGDLAIAVDASTGTRGQTTFHVSQTIVEVPAVWLGRAFDIAWPIRDGASALIRLQAARKIAQAHGGDLEVSAIDRGTAFLLTIPTTT